MASQSIANRVESLDRRVTRLEELPVRMDRVESQIVHLRTEMHDEFSAVRAEMRDEFAAVRKEMREQFAVVRSEIVAGDEETRRYMRVLFEEYVGRIRVIDEGTNRDV